MLNGVNLNEDLNSSQLDKQSGVSSVVTNPLKNPYQTDKNLLIDETAISDEAVNLYQKEQDVKKFTKLAMSDPNDLSHEEIISNLFKSGVNDLFSDETFTDLSSNQNLLNDLSL